MFYFWILSQFCIPGIISHFSYAILSILYIATFNLLILFEAFLYLCLSFSYYAFFSGSPTRVMLSSLNKLGDVGSSSIFLKNVYRSIYLFLKYFTSIVKQPELGIFFGNIFNYELNFLIVARLYHYRSFFLLVFSINYWGRIIEISIICLFSMNPIRF